MSGTGNTTVPADPSTRSSPAPADDRVFALVICHCIPEPEREGEVALFDPADAVVHWIIGREIERGPARVHFFQQRPGEMIDAGALTGRGISHEQLRIGLEGDGLRVCNVGNAAVYVDGCKVPKDHGVLAGAGSVIEVFGHSVFVVERRPRTIDPPSRLLQPLPPFGERCAMGFDGNSPLAWALREDIAYVANARGNVLVLGETGTGKDVTARAIHAVSERAGGPSVAVNCAEMTAELTAARFFGVRKNYPNSGSPETEGFFGAATGGDLFLDEIGCLDKQLQKTLLRASESGYIRVGEVKARPLGCKITAATNMGEASLAEDFFMRFGTVIRTPALRERPSDIAQIVREELLRHAETDAAFEAAFVRVGATGRRHVLVDSSLIVNLLRHPLPGNVRQVHTILRSAIRAARGVAPLRWPAVVPAPPASALVPTRVDAKPDVSVDEVEAGLEKRARQDAQPSAPSKALILEALDRVRWHYGKAARALGITEHQLYRLREKFGIP